METGGNAANATTVTCTSPDPVSPTAITINAQTKRPAVTDPAQLARQLDIQNAKLRRLCGEMAELLADCKPQDATIEWVIRRLDALEEWDVYARNR